MRTTARRGVLVVLLAMATASLAAFAQPIQWQNAIPNLGFGSTFESASAALAEDPSGNVYVGTRGAAFQSFVSRIDTAGVLGWTAEVGGGFVCAPSCGTSRVGIAADTNGAYAAANTYRGPMACPLGCGYGYVRGLAALDGTNSYVYATPSTQPVSAGLRGLAAAPGGGAVAVGYDAAGGLLVRTGAQPFERRYGSVMTGVAVLASGAILVSGYDPGGDPYVRRYSSAGDVDWTRTRTGMSACVLFAADAAGRTACAGSADVTVYDPNGSPLWGPLPLVTGAMAFDGAGNLWVTGQTCAGTAHHCAATLAKYDPTGTRVAFDSLADPARGYGWNAIATGPAGEVYVTGTTRPITVAPPPPYIPADMLTGRYDSTGTRSWFAVHNGAADSEDRGDALVATADGVIVGAYVYDTAVSSIMVLKYGAAALPLPGIVLSASPNPAIPGQPVTLTATLSGATAPAGTVSFHDGTTRLCAAVPLIATNATTASASCVVPALTSTSQRYFAAYGGGTGYPPAAADVTVVIASAATMEVPTLSFAGPALLTALLGLLAMREARRRG